MTNVETLAKSLLQGRRFLVVDDDEFNGLVTADFLGEIPRALVTRVSSGAAALASLHVEPYDAVLMDIRMPGMDGFETTRRIRAELGLSHLVVIALSAHLAPEDRGQCTAAGMNDFLPKPLEPHRLIETLARWLAPPARFQALISGDEPGAFSPDLGLRRCMGKRELYDKIADRYLQTRRGILDDMALAWSAGDTDAALRIAHGLISTAGTLGATALSDLARELEEAAQARDGGRWQRLLDRARLEHERVCAALETHLGRSSNRS